MRSTVLDVMPAQVRRSLRKLGADVSIARRKRGLTVQAMAERLGVSKSTYLRAEKGEPTVAVAVYAMALFTLGVGTPFAELIDPGRDEQGLLLDRTRLPKRIRAKKEPQPL